MSNFTTEAVARVGATRRPAPRSERPPGRPRRRRHLRSPAAPPPSSLLALWQFASCVGWIDPATLASPVEVWHAFTERGRSGELRPSILTSLRRVLIGLAIGVTIGTVLGLIAGLSRIGEELVDAPLQMLRTLPFLGLMPLLIVWLGIGEGVKVGLVVIGVIYPIYLNLHKGIRASTRASPSSPAPAASGAGA